MAAGTPALSEIMNVLSTLFRRLGLSPHPLRGAAGGLVENSTETRDCWLLVQSGMPRY